MKTSKIFAAALALVAGAAFSSTASAKVFAIDYDDAGIWAAYDDTNEVYGLKFKTDASKDGFWLVVSDGPNPKSNANEYAILYGDLKNNRISAYTYDGANGPDSYKTGTFLGSYDTPFADGGQHFKYGYDLTMVSIDVGAINGAFDTADWDGVQIGPEAGIWYHQSAGSNFVYGTDGQLLDYSFTDQMWLDSAFDTTWMLESPDCAAGGKKARPFLQSCNPTQPNSSGGGSVPVPGGLAFIAIGLAGLGLRRRK